MFYYLVEIITIPTIALIVYSFYKKECNRNSNRNRRRQMSNIDINIPVNNLNNHRFNNIDVTNDYISSASRHV